MIGIRKRQTPLTDKHTRSRRDGDPGHLASDFHGHDGQSDEATWILSKIPSEIWTLNASQIDVCLLTKNGVWVMVREKPPPFFVEDGSWSEYHGHGSRPRPHLHGYDGHISSSSSMIFVQSRQHPPVRE